MTPTIEISIETYAGHTGHYFTLTLTEKTSFLVALDGAGLFITKLNTPFIGGLPFNSMADALAHYKNAKMLSALRAIPGYIAAGLTGPRAVQA